MLSRIARNEKNGPGSFLLLILLIPVLLAFEEGKPRLLEVDKIWDKAPHNAFTDLIRFEGRWFCTFREGGNHVSDDGAVRVITSIDGEAWESAALLTSNVADLRDPKCSVTPDGRLMIVAVAALHRPAEARHWTKAWSSGDGYQWSEAADVAHKNMWLWRITWFNDKAYGVAYATDGRNITRLYCSRDGRSFEIVKDPLFDKGFPNEAALRFLDDGECLCFLRRERDAKTAQLGRSHPPYTSWTWKDLGVRIGGPNMIVLPDGRVVAACRLYDKKTRTSLCWLDPEEGTLVEFMTLPSGGDTSYPGLVWHEETLWISYYSSHEMKTSIYLAKVEIP